MKRRLLIAALLFLSAVIPGFAQSDASQPESRKTGTGQASNDDSTPTSTAPARGEEQSAGLEPVTVVPRKLKKMGAAAFHWAHGDSQEKDVGKDQATKPGVTGTSPTKASDPSVPGHTPATDATFTAPSGVTVQMQSVAPSERYIIGPDDVLHVAVWKEADLTATLPVRPDGMISMPLLNDVQAAGLTPMQLAAVLTEKLKKYIATPRVTVVVTQMKPERIYVLGEVLRHEPISLQPNMTMLQALATAGFTPFANTKAIYLLRVENGQQQRIPFNYKQVMKGEAVAQNIVLKPGDTIVVP